MEMGEKRSYLLYYTIGYKSAQHKNCLIVLCSISIVLCS